MDEESVFAEAILMISLAERNAFLDRVCAGKEELRVSVEGLLQADQQENSPLDVAPLSYVPSVAVSGIARATTELTEVIRRFLTPTDRPGCMGMLGKYDVIEIVGHGGMGIVLRAYDTKLNRVVAIKVFSPKFVSDSTAARRFLREAQAAAAVNHDHVVTIHAVHENFHPPFIVMEFIDGQSLQDRIAKSGVLKLTEILRIGSQLASGLAAAHEQGLVHRDVKPTNILLENGVERVKITDFGLARRIDDRTLTRSGEIAGTPDFMSPEQAQGHSVDARSDLFSLGSVMYMMCTGHSPFAADSSVAVMRRVCDDRPQPISDINATIPGWLCDLIDKLLEKDPRNRFGSAEEVARLLERRLAAVQASPFQRSEIPQERDAGALLQVPLTPAMFWPITAAIAVVVAIAAFGITITIRDNLGKVVGQVTAPTGSSVKHDADGTTRIETPDGKTIEISPKTPANATQEVEQPEPTTKSAAHGSRRMDSATTELRTGPLAQSHFKVLMERCLGFQTGYEPRTTRFTLVVELEEDLPESYRWKDIHARPAAPFVLVAKDANGVELKREQLEYRAIRVQNGGQLAVSRGDRFVLLADLIAHEFRNFNIPGIPLPGDTLPEQIRSLELVELKQ